MAEMAFERKKKGPLFIILLLLILTLLIYEDDDKGNQDPRFSEIVFPQVFDTADPDQSRSLFERGLKKYKKMTFSTLKSSANLFRESLEYQLKDNPALGYLLMSYARLMRSSPNPEKSKHQIYDLIRLARPYHYTNKQVAMGKAIFFLEIKKPHVAQKSLEDYLRVSGAKFTNEFLSLYLLVLIENGQYEKARDAFSRLQKSKVLDSQTYYALASYELIDQRDSAALNYIDQGVKESTYDIPLLFLKAFVLTERGESESLKTLIKWIQEEKIVQSIYEEAKFLELQGNLFALKGKSEQAAKLYRSSLKLRNSTDLEAKLSSLEIGGGEFAQRLIRISKIKHLLRKARDLLRRNRPDDALYLAIEATDLDPNFLPAQLDLAKIQIQRGMFSDSLRRLEKLYKTYPRNQKVVEALIEAQIESFHLESAQRRLLQLKDSVFKANGNFHRLQGKLFFSKKEFTQSIRSYRRAVKMRPLNDQWHYELAHAYFRTRRFKNAKESVLLAIEFNPEIVDYHILFSQILYEVDGLDIALGYLRETEDQFPEDGQILSHMAILYYRAGKVKDYRRLHKELKENSKIDKDFYEFLIETAILNNNDDEVIQTSTELIKQNPADLKNRMLLALYLSEKGRYQESLAILRQVENRLDSYPKLYYTMADVYLGLGKKEEALKSAKKEVEQNPDSHWGYVALGEVYMASERYPEAKEAFESALKQKVSSVDALMGLAYIRYAQNFLSDAFELYKRAKKLDPSNPIVHRQLGHIHLKQGQRDLAYEEFRVYLDLRPTANDIEKIKALMRSIKNEE